MSQAPSVERITELKAKGYIVEDMAAEYGPEFNGEFRWLNLVTQDFQDWGTSDTEADAWVVADRNDYLEASELRNATA